MRAAAQEHRLMRFGYGALAFLFLLLVYRCERAVTAVIRTQLPSPATTDTEASADGFAYAALAARDSLVATATTAGRDPFQPPRPRVAAAPRSPAANREAPLPEAPRLQAVLFDSTSPLVKLVMGDKVSDWLHTGYIFQGWTVVSIGETTVEVHDKHRTVILRAR